MSSLTELLNPTFFFFLGILLLAVALISFYYESRFKEQNHKLNSMLSIVSSLAEELNGVKFGLNQVAMMGGAHAKQTIIPFQDKIIKHDLIEVSDDDAEDDDSDADDDDIDEDNDIDADEDNDSDSDDDADSEVSEDVSIVDLDTGVDIELSEYKDITILKINNDNTNDNTDKTVILELDNLQDFDDDDTEDDMHDLESVSSEDSINETLEIHKTQILDQVKNEFIELSESKELEEVSNLNNDDIKKINIMDLEEVKSINANDTNDYKKMSVQKLRIIVVERKLALEKESAKLKKPELLKLLEEE